MNHNPTTVLMLDGPAAGQVVVLESDHRAIYVFDKDGQFERAYNRHTYVLMGKAYEVAALDISLFDQARIPKMLVEAGLAAA